MSPPSTVGKIVGSICWFPFIQSGMRESYHVVFTTTYQSVPTGTGRQIWSAKPVFAGSIPARCSIKSSNYLLEHGETPPVRCSTRCDGRLLVNSRQFAGMLLEAP